MKNKTPYIYVVIFIAIIGAILYFYKNPIVKQVNAQKCPEDYPDTNTGFEAKTTAMNYWINGFYDKNPGASLSEMAKARYQFYIENNCERTLQRYYEAKEGKADPAEMKIIRDTIQEEIDNQAMKNLIDALKNDEPKQTYEKPTQ